MFTQYLFPEWKQLKVMKRLKKNNCLINNLFTRSLLTKLNFYFCECVWEIKETEKIAIIIKKKIISQLIPP